MGRVPSKVEVDAAYGKTEILDKQTKACGLSIFYISFSMKKLFLINVIQKIATKTDMLCQGG